MRKIMEILTPENVYLEYELAGLGSRFVALILDHMIQGGLTVLIVISMLAGGINFNSLKVNSVIIALGIVLTFIISFGYFVFFEMIMNGQTPGKKFLKLRVVMGNGEPLGFFESFIRNILRIGDMLPGLNLFGAIFILFSKDYKRIGDYAANTIVIRLEKCNALIAAQNLIKQQEEKPVVNRVYYPLSNFEYNILKEFLVRKDSLGDRKQVFTYHLNKYFINKFNIEKDNKDPVDFFEEMVRENSQV